MEKAPAVFGQMPMYQYYLIYNSAHCKTGNYISVFSSEYIFMSITLPFFTALLLNVPSY